MIWPSWEHVKKIFRLKKKDKTSPSLFWNSCGAQIVARAVPWDGRSANVDEQALAAQTWTMSWTMLLLCQHLYQARGLVGWLVLATKSSFKAVSMLFLYQLVNHLRKRPTTANLVKNGQKWPFSGAKKLGFACLNTNMRTIDVVNLVYDCSCGF